MKHKELSWNDIAFITEYCQKNNIPIGKGYRTTFGLFLEAYKNRSNKK